MVENLSFRLWVSGVLAVAFLLIVAAGCGNPLAVGTAWAGGPVVVARSGAHDGVTRLVFNWKIPVPYKVSRTGNEVSITFEQPGQVDFSQVDRVKPPKISRWSQEQGPGRLLVRLEVADGAVLQDYRDRNGVVLEIRGTQPDEQASAVPDAAVARPDNPKAANDKNLSRAVEVVPDPLVQSENEKSGPEKGLEAGAQKVARAVVGQPLYTRVEAGDGQENAPVLVPGGGARLLAQAPSAGNRSGPPEVSGQQQPTATPRSPVPPATVQPRSPTTNTPLTQRGAAAEKVLPSAAASSNPPEARAITTTPMPVADPALAAVSIVLTQPIAAAAFVRAGFVYFVFDRRLDQPPQIEVGPQAPPVGKVEMASSGEVSALRFQLPQGITPAVQRSGNVWRVILDRGLVARATSLSIEPQPDFTLGARVIIKVDGNSRPVRFVDPVVGDDLIVVPLMNAPQVVTQTASYPQLDVLPSLQGVFVRPISDGIIVRSLEGLIEISAQNGLTLSPDGDVRNTPVAVDMSRVLDVIGWRQGNHQNFNEVQRRLQSAINVTAEGDQRDRIRLDLARFFFAYGLVPESLGMIDVVLQTLPTLAVRPEIRALRGAAFVWSGQAKEGLNELSDPDLEKDDEISLWRGVALATLGDWGKARGLLNASDGILASYPEPFFSRMSMLSAEAAIRGNDPREGVRLLDRLDQRVVANDFDQTPLESSLYLRGLAALRAGNVTEAAEKWSVVRGMFGDRSAEVRAAFGLIDLDLASGRITQQEALVHLERLVFAWRGDELEVAIRHRLANLQIQAGAYPQAFRNLDEIARVFPDSQVRLEVEQEMSDIFSRVFFRDGAEPLPPLQALAFYDRWRDLTPAGRVGNQIIERLAGRLVQVDLLDRAGDLLSELVRTRLSGAEKAVVGARLAAIRILDDQAAAAADAIEISDSNDMPDVLRRERRLIYARALADLGRSEQALLLLTDDDSRVANLLRIGIAWRGQRWHEAEKALAKLIGPPPLKGELPADLRQPLLNRAVALALAGDSDGLADLRRTYSASLEGTPESTAFRLLTRPEQVTGLLDIETVQKRLGEVDLFQSFLKSYQQRAVTSLNQGGAGGAKVN